MQRDIWLAALPDPIGSVSGYTRPVVIVQNDALNISRLSTYLVVPLTSLAVRHNVPWNLSISAKTAGLSRDSVAQINLMLAVDERQLIERIGSISKAQLTQLFTLLDRVLGRA